VIEEALQEYFSRHTGTHGTEKSVGTVIS